MVRKWWRICYQSLFSDVLIAFYSLRWYPRSGHPRQPKKPLIRLRVDYTDERDLINVIRFGHRLLLFSSLILGFLYYVYFIISLLLDNTDERDVINVIRSGHRILFADLYFLMFCLFCKVFTDQAGSSLIRYTSWAHCYGCMTVQHLHWELTAWVFSMYLLHNFRAGITNLIEKYYFYCFSQFSALNILCPCHPY
jgi:hypothetical protein